jgi:hypothetical protein
MQTAIELAERKGKARACAYYVFAAIILLLLIASFGPNGTDFFRGMWGGFTLVAMLNLLPWGRWLKPGNAVVRLLDDESVREHRRMSGTAGFAAAMASALALTFVTVDSTAISALDVARLIATAGMTAFLVGFATLELRAARG